MMIHGKKTICVAAVILVVAVTTGAWAEDPYEVEWKRQIGTSRNDHSWSVAVDVSGNAYLGGYTEGDLGGPSTGGTDVFLRKYDSAGNEVWTTQIGTSGAELVHSVAVDASGNAYLTGHTYGGFSGPSAGPPDAFLSKFGPGGDEVWTTQLGTRGSDRSWSVAVDASDNAYISGYTSGSLDGSNAGNYDAFVGKFDSGGNEVWTTQIGTSSHDYSYSIAVDASGNAYISGYTSGSLGGSNAGSGDAFLSKLDSDGNEVWTTQIGTSMWDGSSSVAVDAFGNAYISGSTEGDLGGLNAGRRDVFLSMFDTEGDEVWTRQIGTSSNDGGRSIALDVSGNVFISGYTQGDLGALNAGSEDVFLSKFDSAGNELWTTQIGSNSEDQSWSVAVDVSGSAYISGFTKGDLGGPNVGGRDAFLVKYEVPEPATLSLLALGGLAVLRRRRSC
jgi:hypothetical protein